MPALARLNSFYTPKKYLWLLLVLGQLITGLPVLHAKKFNYSADNIVINTQKDEAILTGNAVVSKKQQILRAHKIIINNKKQLTEAFTNVTFQNKADSFFYSGDYLKYNLKKEIVYAKGNPQLENKKENVIMEADNFIVYLKKDRITSSGTTRITVQKDEDSTMLLKGETSIYDLKNETLTLETNVEIYETAEHQFNPNENYVITCHKSRYIITSGHMHCYDNVRIENVEAQSLVTGDYLFLEEKENRGTTTGNAKFTQKNESNTVLIEAEKMTLFRTEEKIYLSNDVFITESNAQGEYLTSLWCDQATNYYNSDESYLECYDNVTLSNFIKDSTVHAQFIYYNFTYEKGYAEKEPSMHISDPNNDDLIFAANRMELDQKNRIVYFKSNVAIHKTPPPLPHNAASTRSVTPQRTSLPRPLPPSPAEEWITCKNAFYTYIYNHNKTFECRGDVVISNDEERAEIYSDRLIHYLNEEKSELSGNVTFSSLKNAPDSTIHGRARKITNYDKTKKIFFDEKVYVEEHNANKEIISIITGERFIYNYKTKRFFEGFAQSKVEKPLDHTTVYADHAFYYVDEEHSVLQKKPLFINMTENSTKLLAYAETMEIFFNEERTELKKNTHIIEVNARDAEPRVFNLNAFRGKHYNHLSCQNGTYYYANAPLPPATSAPVPTSAATAPASLDTPAAQPAAISVADEAAPAAETLTHEISTPALALDTTDPASRRTFTCQDDVVITYPAENMVGYGGKIYHDFTTERSILSENPQLILTGDEYVRTIHTDEMILEQKNAQSLFNGAVHMTETDQDDFLRGEIFCHKAKYNFKSLGNEILSCRKDVKLFDFNENIEIVGQELRYDLTNQYTLITGQPILTWRKDDGVTIIKSKVLERFNKKEIMYAKGNVNVNNGENEAYSSLGIYELTKKAITLYGAPKIRHLESGDEFTSETVTFNLEKNVMLMQSDVTGSIFISK